MLFSALFLTVLGGFLHDALAQSGVTSEVICMSSFSWMDNSLNQNPCLVAAYLSSQCSGGIFDISPLPPNFHYNGPTLDTVTPCQCSTVVFSLFSACGFCQNRTVESWTMWSTNCTNTYISSFPEAIPSGTAVQNWAYLDVVSTNNWNPLVAQADATGPESTPLPKSTNPSTIASPASTPGPQQPTNSSQNSPAKISNKSNTGAIAGGVVGGVVGVVAIVFAVFFVMRRRRLRGNVLVSTPDGSFSHAAGDAPLSPAQMTEHSGSRHIANPSDLGSIAPAVQPKLYDPDDPTTYPTTPMPQPMLSVNSSAYAGSTSNISSGQLGHFGQYSGAPEL